MTASFIRGSVWGVLLAVELVATSCATPQPVIASPAVCDGLGQPPEVRKWPKDSVMGIKPGDMIVHLDGNRNALGPRDVVLRELAARGAIDELQARRDWDRRVSLCLGLGMATDGGVDAGN